MRWKPRYKVNSVKSLNLAANEPNPEFNTLMKAVDMVVPIILTFCSLSVVAQYFDGAKFVALTATLDDDKDHEKAWEALKGYTRDIQNAYRSVLYSPFLQQAREMNSGGVINHQTSCQFPFVTRWVFPAVFEFWPCQNLNATWASVMNGVADAFVHVMEQYLTYPVNAKVRDSFSESLLKILIEEGRAVRANPNDMETRKNIMWTATMALNGLIGTGVPQDWTTHMIGHELTSLRGIDHARTLTIVLPGVMRELKDSKKDKAATVRQKRLAYRWRQL